MIERLRLSWAAGTAEAPFVNFGDALSPIVVGFLAGCSVQHAHFADADKMVAIGTILQHICGPSTVWGTGASPRMPVTAAPADLDVRAVRGPITRDHVLGFGVACPEVFGDPGVLLPRIVGPRTDQPAGILLVPHLSQLAIRHPQSGMRRSTYTLPEQGGSDEAWRMAAPLVGPTVDCVLDLVRQIRDAAVVLTGSVHGFVIGTAFGVPTAFVMLSDRSGAETRMQVLGPDRTMDPRLLDYWLGLALDGPPPVWATRRGRPLDIAGAAAFARAAHEDRTAACTASADALVAAFPVPLSREPDAQRRIRRAQELVRLF